MSCWFLLLASKGDAFGQGVGERLENCECHLQGKSYVEFCVRLANSTWSIYSHFVIPHHYSFLLGCSGITLVLVFVEREETPDFVNA